MDLYIRADADAKTGTGHVMRCIALGQAWRDAGGHVAFMTACVNPQLLNRMVSEGFDVRGTAIPANPPTENSWLVLDGYHFDSEYQRRLKQTGWRVLAIDDMAHLAHYYADIVLNQNIDAERYSYNGESGMHLMLGPAYALLRREFSRWSGWSREIPPVAQKLLITMGGSDPNGVTLRVVEAVRAASIDGLESVVVVGAECKSLAELRRTAEGPGIRIETNVADMAPLMTWADLAVSAAGSTCWELAFLGLPACLISVADNQRNLATGLHKRGCAVDLGWHTDLSVHAIANAIRSLAFDADRRAILAQRSAKLVDGKGPARVIQSLTN